MGIYAKWIFPRMVNWALSGEECEEVRQAVLAPARGQVLEIGFGTGLNLPHYPEGVERLTVVDPNEGMNTLARRRIAESPIEVDHRVLGGESLPLEDGSIDTVVSTWTLCSIPEVGKALGEIRRVLKPEGRFLFAEHGLAEDEKVQRWQHRLNPIQKVVGDGCNLNRDMWQLIGDAGFGFEERRNFYLRKTPRLVGYMYAGVAVKG